MSEDEDDWFESALREAGEAEERTAEAEAESEAAEAAETGGESADFDEFGEDEPAAGEEPLGRERGDSTFGGGAGAETGAGAGGEAAPGEGATGTGGGTAGGPDASGGESPFETDFASAFQNAPDPGAAGQQPGGGPGASDQQPGGFGGGPDVGEAEPFGEPTSFDEEEFESNIERLDVGIEGLDEMILGGIPKRSLMVAIGSAGTGKTTFGMEFLRTALEEGNNAVYISLEESRERILDTADEKGWEFTRYEEQGQLAVVTFDPVEMANTLSSIQSELPRLIEEFDADRLVLDSVSLLEMMYDHPSKRRSEVFDFARSLKEAGVTTFVTSEASENSSYTSRHGIIEYLADAVFILQYVRPSDFRETRLAIEIQKIRDANHSRETKPYEITDEGISVYRQANIF